MAVVSVDSWSRPTLAVFTCRDDLLVFGVDKPDTEEPVSSLRVSTLGGGVRTCLRLVLERVERLMVPLWSR